MISAVGKEGALQTCLMVRSAQRAWKQVLKRDGNQDIEKRVWGKGP